MCEGFFMAIDHVNTYEKGKTDMWTCVEQLILETLKVLFNGTCVIEASHFMKHCDFHPSIDPMQ
jgi:hypothetical protein